MEDSTIQIYNVRVDEVKTKLKGHQKRISGLAFSQSLNILLFMWSIDGWERKKSRPIQALPGHPTPLVGETNLICWLSMKVNWQFTMLNLNVYARNNSTFPVVIAAHPSDPYQFALGMSDGGVHVIESSEAKRKWGGSTSQDLRSHRVLL
ncbi:hypothetical protein ACS0TY_011940 [Phlomoides rotata]